MNTEQMEMKEREISLVDLIAEILLRWRTLLFYTVCIYSGSTKCGAESEAAALGRARRSICRRKMGDRPSASGRTVDRHAD